MSLVKRNNLVLPSLMNEIFNPDWFGGMENVSRNVPAVNIVERDEDFTLEFAVPGYKKEDFNIELDNDILTVSSEISTEDKSTNDNFTRREFSYSTFKRSFTLPETIDSGKVNAKYEDGLLKLTLPKREEALPKPKRLIEIG
ncbi:Hsp20/alpha crystallin family protein [Croceitalea sp. MTPC5]|uniref:Hsp20/alpha crystallin family protein n=1 Tax=Croceitalea sp. MTPC5 TaxID=3056565 RepID=UPI002B3AA821|nr:Hsp20/alpha crystallin family protein [Croceitalea sp. MTPC5]